MMPGAESRPHNLPLKCLALLERQNLSKCSFVKRPGFCKTRSKVAHILTSADVSGSPTSKKGHDCRLSVAAALIPVVYGPVVSLRRCSSRMCNITDCALYVKQLHYVLLWSKAVMSQSLCKNGRQVKGCCHLMFPERWHKCSHV
jgi:hypothetical protein